MRDEFTAATLHKGPVVPQAAGCGRPPLTEQPTSTAIVTSDPSIGFVHLR